MHNTGHKSVKTAKKVISAAAFIILLIIGLSILRPIHIAQAVTDISITVETERFIVTNNGDTSAENYSYKLFQESTEINSGVLNLTAAGSETVFITDFGYFTLRVYNELSVEVANRSYTRTATQTPTSTNTPTPQPLFSLMSHFDGSGNAVFTIHNYGDSMIYANRYILYESGSKVDEASFYLFSGENKTVTFARDPGNYLLNILNQNDVIVAHDTLNNIPATQTFTATVIPTTTFTPTFTTTSTSTVTSTATKTLTVTSTVTPTVTATTTSILTSTLTFTSTVTKTGTKTVTTTVTPKTVDNSNNGTVQTSTPTAKPWFWYLKKPTSTATLTFSFTPSPQRPTATPAVSVTLTPVMTGSTATGAAATPIPAPQPHGGIPLSLWIIAGFILLGVGGFGVSLLIKK